MTPEILIVGDPAGRRPLADTIAAGGYGVALCSPRELNRRVRTSSPPAVIVACMGDVDPDVLLAGLRRTRAGASIPVILYGRLGGSLRDLADVLDIGADHFIEEPASEGEFEDALMQYAGPPREAGRIVGGRERDRERGEEGRGRPVRRGPARREQPRARRDRYEDRYPDPHGERERERHGVADRRPERERPRPERGKALGELHRTLDRLEAQLRADDPRSDPELHGLGLDGIPDVDPPEGELADDDPLVTDIGDHLRERSGEGYERIRGDDLTQPSVAPHQLGPVARDDGRPRPRAPRRDITDRLGRSARSSTPDEDTGPGRRSWGDEPRADSTRGWERPESEGPLRPRRAGARGPTGTSAVLRARRPDRDEPVRAPELEPEPRRPDRGPEPGRVAPRYDPHARGTPWPTDDFDPSESTMIRRERGDATTRRRSLGDPRDFPWGRAREGEPPARGRPTPARPRPPEPRSLERGREPEREPPAEPREREPPARARRAVRRSREPRAAPPALRIDPTLRETGKLGPEVDVPTVLWALHEQRFTGKLRLTRQRIEKQIWLHDGEAVFARSTATSDRLVDGLLRRGVLTRPQYETARRLAAKEPRRAGELLVDAGFLKARELDVLLRDHLARVIDSTFVWTEGGWSTEPGERTDEALQLEVPMAALILDGVRYRCDASELEDRLTRRVGGRGPLVPRLRTGAELGEDHAAALAASIDELGESFRLLPEEESWLRRFDGRHGVAALLADGADEQALFALLFTLDLGGHVELREQPEPLAESDRDPAQLDGERILERLRLAREADYFELLGVGRDASRSEVRQAYTELSSTFADEALEAESRRRHARELRELRAAIEEARDILADDAMRSAYLAHLS